ncbi:S8 family serine peptidase [Actinoallomurus sp. CA-142502]|uniref:S53 family peptidase n=1 Tax=Actinoallomurus sp. CA-142502 TaxID=3239885 RepID=UPI003D90A9CA
MSILTRRAGLAVLAAIAFVSVPVRGVGSADAGVDPLAGLPVKRACPDTSKPGMVTCLALVRTDVTPQHGIQPQHAPTGLGARELRDAYRLPTATAGKGQTVAIINVFDDPKAESDLAVYRAQYGLPPCTTANGCFRKVNADGSTRLPHADTSWAEEMSLDLDMVSAACPNCRILLVEADEPSIPGLGQGVDTAVRLGAKYISNSYGGAESASAAASDFQHFDHPGVAITAASGDSGYGVLFPATAPHVTAVGGTTLSRASNARGWDETAWSGSGSGCSTQAPKPPWQKDTGCSRRTVADVAAVADPHTGVAVYDTFGFGGWQVVGGTSAAAPIIAGAYALAASLPGTGYAAAVPYAHPDKLHDIVQGSTGTCTPAYLCTAGPGYDGPTGLGTPDGVDAFRAGRAEASRVREAGVSWPALAAARPGPGAPAPRAVADHAVTGGAPARMAAAALRPLVNGGFETGSLAGWTSAGVVTGVTKDHPHSGRYAALLGYPDDPKKGDSVIRQNFTAVRGNRRLSFWYNVSCPDKVRYDWVTVSLRDDTTGVTSTVLPRTCTYYNTWEKAEAPVVGGHAYTLTLLSHDDGYFGDPTSAKFDDVTLS